MSAAATKGWRLERPLYQTWLTMRRRCESPSATSYSLYGARGIRVCERWKVRGQGYANFVADVGPRPTPKHSLDRIDPNGNYEPGNVRWATAYEQRRNTRTNHFVAVGGETLCIADWAARLGLHRTAISHRLRSGWDPVRAVTLPKGASR